MQLKTLILSSLFSLAIMTSFSSVATGTHANGDDGQKTAEQKNQDCVQKTDHKHDSGAAKDHEDCKDGENQQEKTKDGHNHTH